MAPGGQLKGSEKVQGYRLPRTLRQSPSVWGLAQVQRGHAPCFRRCCLALYDGRPVGLDRWRQPEHTCWTICSPTCHRRTLLKSSARHCWPDQACGSNVSSRTATPVRRDSGTTSRRVNGSFWSREKRPCVSTTSHSRADSRLVTTSSSRRIGDTGSIGPGPTRTPSGLPFIVVHRCRRIDRPGTIGTASAVRPGVRSTTAFAVHNGRRCRISSVSAFPASQQGAQSGFAELRRQRFVDPKAKREKWTLICLTPI